MNQEPFSFAIHVGNRIKFYRKIKHMSLNQLAGEIHRSTSTLSKYENGIIPIGVDVLYDISTALDVNIAQFVDYHTPDNPVTDLVHGKPFYGKNRLYLYYYDGRTNRITKTLLTLRHDSSEGNVTPCYCYMDVPSFNQPDDCKYFYDGLVTWHDLIAYITLHNRSFSMEEINMCILNPFHHTQKCWGLMMGISYNPITPFSLKFLFSPNPIPDSVLDPDDLILSKDDIKRIRKLNMMLLNTQEP